MGANGEGDENVQPGLTAKGMGVFVNRVSDAGGARLAKPMPRFLGRDFG
jgi:hypothetical protein